MLQNEFIIVRKFKVEDAKALYDYLSLPETYLYEPGEAVSEAQAAQMCAERARGDSFFAVCDRQSGTMVGHLYFQRCEPAEFLSWELGYIFNPRYQGLGYCTAGAKLLIDYAFRTLGAHRIEAHCNPHNVASWRVLEKCGFTLEGSFKKKAFFRKDENGRPLWFDSRSYGLLDEDYLKAD